MCATTIVYWNFLFVSLCVTWEIYFLIDSNFSRLIRAAGKVAPSVKFSIIKPLFLNDHNNFTKTLIFIVWCVVWLIFKLCIIKVLIWLIIFLTHVTKSQTVFWDWSLSWHFIVVNKKCFSSSRIVLQWHCLRINIHESIHLNLKLEVTMKSLQLCMFIHILSLCISFFLFITFWCFTCKNVKHIFPPLSDNNFFLFQFVS